MVRGGVEMELVKFTKYEKNTLKGFVDIKLSSGIILNGLIHRPENTQMKKEKNSIVE